MSYLGDRKVVLHLNASNFYGGPEKQIVEHLKLLNTSRYQGIVASFEAPGETSEILEMASKNGIQSRRISTSSAFDVSAVKTLSDIVKNDKVSLICSHGYKSTVLSWYVGRVLGIPVVAFSRGYTGENAKVAFYEWIERLILRRVKRIVAVSYGQRDKLLDKGITKTPINVVHNAVDPVPGDSADRGKYRGEICGEHYQVPATATVVVSAGRLSPEKGHRYLIEAIALIPPTEEIFFFICGDGALKQELMALAAALKVDKRCFFVGFTRNVSSFYKAMDFLVLPSLSEGLPNVVLESFAHGKPVIATHVGGVPELVEHEVNGYIVPAKNPEEMARKIIDLHLNKEKASAFGDAGRRRITEDFSFAGQNEKIENVYASVLNNE